MLTAKVNGMVCDFCARAVEKVFKKEDNVEAITVDMDAGEVQITLTSGTDMSDEKVEELIKKSGYDLVSVTRGTA